MMNWFEVFGGQDVGDGFVRRMILAELSCKSIQSGPHIDSLPRQPALSANANPVTVVQVKHERAARRIAFRTQRSTRA
jgi:hypothetical protein